MIVFRHRASPTEESPVEIETMVEQIDTERFLKLSRTLTAIDVRSPVEYEEDHIPGSLNVPLFSNEERAEIGTAYTRQGSDHAIALGEGYAAPRIPWYLEQASRHAVNGEILVLCARGGMRSERFSELLKEHGFHPYRLKGGYKAYRTYVRASFYKKLPLIVLGGRTGSGKTDILKELKKMNEQVLDLEGLAGHRGSAFGSVGLGPQPTTRYFENCLFDEICRLDGSRPVWVEDESVNIGRVVLPPGFYDQLESSEIVLIKMDREQRVERLCDDYGDAGHPPLMEALGRIRKRLGPENYQKARDALAENDLPAAISLVLDYYDKCYDYYQESRGRGIRCRIRIESRDMKTAARQILSRLNDDTP